MIGFAQLIDGIENNLSEIKGVSDYHCPTCGKNLTKIEYYTEPRIYLVCEKCRVTRVYRDKIRGME